MGHDTLSHKMGSWRMLESNTSGKTATPQGLRHDVLGCCGPCSFCCGATDRFPVCGEWLPKKLGIPPKSMWSPFGSFWRSHRFRGRIFLGYPTTSLSYLTLYSCRIVDLYLEIEGKLTPGSQSQWVNHLLFLGSKGTLSLHNLHWFSSELDLSS